MAIQKNTQKKIKKVSKALKKASNLHAKQAKTLDAIKMKKGGIPSNVKNPSLYSKAKSKAKAKSTAHPTTASRLWEIG